MAWYIFFTSFFEIASDVTRYMRYNNVVHYYIYCVLETALVPILLANLHYMKIYRKLIYTLTAILLIGVVFEISTALPNKVNTITRIAQCVFFVVLSFFTINQIKSAARLRIMFGLVDFWFCMSIITYFSLHCFVILFSNLAIDKFGNGFGKNIWMLNSFASILSNGLLIYGIWKIYLSKRFT